MSEGETVSQDRLEQEPKPPFADQSQQYPGLESQMNPRPDYGEASYKGHGRLQGKAALITGGDSGIGRAVAVAYAREGADVLISYLNEEEDAAETLRIVRESGRTGVGVAGDICDESHCKELVERALREFGHLDILVNNAAFQMDHQGIQDISSEELDRTFRTNIYAMFYLCKAALPHMQPGSSIINTSSIEGSKPEPSLLAYASTKGAIITFTKGLAQETVEHGVRVNSVAPGPVWTPLIVSTMSTEKVAEFGKQSPMQRPAQPVELASVYVFLASTESSYITGEIIGITGGMPLP